MYESDSEADNAALAERVADLLGRGRAALITDIDGTISPIVARPEEAIVLPQVRQALAGLKSELDVVAVVTGRSVKDACRMVGLDGLTYIGNHGMELLVDGQPQTVAEARPWAPRVRAVLAEVAQSLGNDAEGVIIEDKGATASLHYRLSSDPDEMRGRLLEILARRAVTSGLRVEEGRRVINLLPPLTVTKGSAVSSLAREHHLDAISYLGDDITDAHAFRALELLRQAGVRALGIGVVGPETPPSVRQLSDASVPSVHAVAELLCGVLARLKSNDRMGSRAPGSAPGNV